MGSTRGTTQGGRGLQFPVESGRQSIVDIEEDTNNDRDNTCLAIKEDSINEHENTYLDIEEDSINDDENNSEIRIESLNAEFESARESIDSTGNSTNLDTEIEEDTNSIKDPKHIYRKDSWRNAKVTFGLMFVINFALELVSTILDQLSSANNSRYARIVMSISYAAIVICIFELFYKWKKEKVNWRWKKILPWFYYPLPSEWPFTFMDIIVLICALGQSIVTTFNYLHAYKPIKISVWPIIFAFGLLCSKLWEYFSN